MNGNLVVDWLIALLVIFVNHEYFQDNESAILIPGGHSYCDFQGIFDPFTLNFTPLINGRRPAKIFFT